VLDASNLSCTFLTNEFDEDLSEVDTSMFIPSLRADTLVFKLADQGVADRLAEASGVELAGGTDVVRAVKALATKFKGWGARSAAISTPPQFCAPQVDSGEYDAAVRKVLAGQELSGAEQCALQAGTIHAVAQACHETGMPFQIMYGAVRGAYPHGVYQGQDLPQGGDTIAGLLPLLNAYPQVTFCLSVLSDSQIHELNSYGWILQNVVLSGHWWYSTIPAYIQRDLAARVQSVPGNKLVGYYSDMYKLEFGLAKFNMYRRVMARTLASEFVEPGYGTEEQALDLARAMLRDNAARVFGL
jgi:glucuronate isomerase